MSFYQNVMSQEFRGNWVLGDRQYVLEFICPANVNQSDYQLAWNPEPYDFSTYNTLTLNYAWDTDFKNYSALSVNVAGASPAATLASEVVTALNNNAIFAEMFVAKSHPIPVLYNNVASSVLIVKKPNRIKQTIRQIQFH